MSPTEFSFEALEAPLPAPSFDDGSALDPVVGILARAEAEAEMVRAAAHSEGYEAGRAEALAALSPALEALQTAVVRPARSGSPPPTSSRSTPSSWRCSWPRRSSAARSPSSPRAWSRPCAAHCAGSSSASA